MTESKRIPVSSLTFTEFAELLHAKGVKFECDTCGGGEGWTLFSESDAGEMIEMMMLSYDKNILNQLDPAEHRAWSSDFMKRNPFFATMCRKCGNTKFFHKYTLLGDHGKPAR